MLSPEKTRARPSGSVVTVGYQREFCRSATRVAVLVFGSQRVLSLSPLLNGHVAAGDEQPAVRELREAGAEEVARVGLGRE